MSQQDLKQDAKDYWCALNNVFTLTNATIHERETIRRWGYIKGEKRTVRGYVDLWNCGSEQIRRAYANLLACKSVLARTRKIVREERATRRLIEAVDVVLQGFGKNRNGK